MPLSIASVRTPCTIGNMPALLRSISSGADTHRSHDRAQDAEVRGGEGFDQVSEMRQEGGFAAHEIDQRSLCPAGRSGTARTATASKKMAMFMAASASRLNTQALSWRIKPSTVCDQTGLRTMTFPGQGGNPNLSNVPEKASRNCARSAAWNLLGKKKGVVLVGPHRLLATPFRTHQQQAAILSDGRVGRPCSKSFMKSRRFKSEVISAISVNLQPLPMEPLDLSLDVARCTRQVVEAAGAVDSPGDELGVAGEQPEDIDILEEADIVAVRPDRETTLVVLRHQQQRLEDEVLRLHRDNVEMADLPDRRVERQGDAGRRPWTGSCR